MITTFSEVRRWTATGVLTSRRGPDEGSLPVPRPPVTCPAQPRVEFAPGLSKFGPASANGVDGFGLRRPESRVARRALLAPFFPSRS
jgi:hypothetical protein